MDGEEYSRHQRTGLSDSEYAPMPYLDRPQSCVLQDHGGIPPPHRTGGSKAGPAPHAQREASPVAAPVTHQTEGEMSLKKCTSCGESKDEGAYSRTQWHRGGKSKCMACTGTRGKPKDKEVMEVDGGRGKRTRDDPDAASSAAGLQG